MPWLAHGGHFILHLDAIAHRRYRIEAGTSLKDGFPNVITIIGPLLIDSPIEVRASMTPGQLRGFYRCAIVR